ncbi:DNA alkylation repair protein [Vibrio crassostreae]|uniref:DNA alkylation repair protein n=1 Tax=Vibrio crassostreae TaxID=246167 RepID=UPI0005DBB715|nr:DNA alkylation repair protein [Vibrio crassostreae]ROO57909.1 3-methyladenine DNA glycosylase AlkD [Vibrio crassostreae]ROO74259.1 3-methyladenine DNA glycosylase AlkD [Vibrio crassostreae]ROO76820.1 3-methyladenine DNA glycosylase AlkD [Vibrio crassostreae]ROP24402.1 3-methyladenine DNA glycosylase AlkD [Vibrio crassostreae]ROP24429.1 3-methyladenine DNA glycosylase AlkD [Vibrio crassostreae]
MNIVATVKLHLSEVGYPEASVKTGQVRSISAHVFKTIKNKDISNVLSLCTQLLEERDWALGVIAYDWAFRVRKQYSKETFSIFEHWLIHYVTDWNDCDDFCTHAFGELMSQHNELFEMTTQWVDHSNFAVRRAAAVVLIYPINKNRYSSLPPFKVADLLMKDEHDLVQKGYGWMLKVLSQKEPEWVIRYLKANHTVMPRVAFRYAIEKLDDKTKRKLMSL